MDSSLPDWPPGLPTPLLGRTHTIAPRSEVTRMESGRPRVRPADVESLEVMDATWNFTQDQYNTFQTFFINELEHGEKIFELVTLEQAPDPTKVRQWVREVAFLDATYSFNRSDNLFVVQAVLEIDAEDFEEIDNPFSPVPPVPPTPELPYTFETVCRDTILVSWEIPATYVAGQDVLEAAEFEDGPWYEYIIPVPTAEQKTAGMMEILLNNSYSGSRWFRLVRNDVVIYAPVNPAGSAVAMPQNIAINNTSVSPYSLHGTGPFVRPVSYIENSLISPTPLYVEPVQRLQYNRGVNWDSITTPLTADTPDGAELRWTRDGSDPTATMIWPPPKYEGVDFNARVYAADFSMGIRARCFSGECKSPLAIVLVDVLHDVETMVRTVGNGGGVGGYCDQTRLDGAGNPQESGFSCIVNYGSDGEFETFQDSFACENLNPSTLTIGGKHAIYRKTHVTTNFTSWMGWPAFGVSSSKWLLNAFQPTGFRSSFWNNVPLVYEYGIATVNVAFKALAAGPDFGTGIGGDSGGLSSHCSAVQTFLLAHVPACVGPDNDTLVLQEFEILLSLQNDDEFVIPEEPPVLPDPPEPPEPPVIEVFLEDWEAYTDTETPELEVLNEGTGWNAAWVLNQEVVEEGYDLMDDYTDSEVDEDDSALFGGEGWDDIWYFQDFGDELDYKDNFEEYTDGVVDPSDLTTYVGGEGWEIADDVLMLQSSWRFQGQISGGENWQSYSDQVVTGSTVLDNNDDLTWEEDRWYFN